MRQVNCVVMGTENLQPQKFATMLREASSSSSSSSSSAKIETHIHVETQCPPTPYVVQQQQQQQSSAGFFPPRAPNLDAAFILFSPMRPLSFVRVDAFLDRVLHVPSVKIVLVAVEVDVLGSGNAVASLRGSSRCRPVGDKDVQRYLALKRKWLAKKDELERAQEARWGGPIAFKPPRSLSVFVVPARRNQLLENAVYDFEARDSSTSALKKHVVGSSNNNGDDDDDDSSNQQPSSTLRRSSSVVSKHRYLLRLLEWVCRDEAALNDDAMEKQKKEDEDYQQKLEAQQQQPKQDEEEKENSTAATRKQQRDKLPLRVDHRKEYVRAVTTWNDGAWTKDWLHEVETAAAFFDYQQELFGRYSAISAAKSSSSPSASPKQQQQATADGSPTTSRAKETTTATSESDEWVAISFLGAPTASPSSTLLSPAAVGADAGNDALFASRRLRRQGSMNNNNNSASSFRRDASFSFTLPPQHGNDGDLTQRFAFWNPRTGEVSLSVPKAVVADRQTSAVVAEILDELMMQQQQHRGDDSSSSKKILDLDCAPYLAKKAQIAAAEQRRESKVAAEQKRVKRVSELQQRLSAAERRHRELLYDKRGLEQQRQNICEQRDAVKQLVFDTRKRHVAAKMQLDRDRAMESVMTIPNSSSNDDDDSASRAVPLSLEMSREVEAVRDRYEALVAQLSLAEWRGKQAARWQRELEEYDASGGRAERSRLYLMRFLENQQLRGDLEHVNERNAEDEADIAALRQREFVPLSARRQFLERRKEQLMAEINELVVDDMKSTRSLKQFLGVLVKKNRRRRRRFPFSDVAGLNSSDYDASEAFLDDNSDEEVANMGGGGAEDDDDPHSVKRRRAEDSDYLSEVSFTSSASSSSSLSSTSSSDSSSAASSRPARRRTSPAQGHRTRLFESAIARLRRSMRGAQRVLNLRSTGAIDLRPLKLCKSPALHEVTAAALKAGSDLRDKSRDYDDLIAWIDEFHREVPAAIASAARGGASSLSSPASASSSSSKFLEECAATIARRKWVALQVKERIERQRMQFEEASLVAQLFGAAVTHSRNLAVRSIKFAKSKRQRLFP